MEFPLQAIAAWNRQGETFVANIDPARNERAVVFCAGIAVGRNVNLILDEMFARVMGSARELSLDPAKTDRNGVPYSVDDAVVFSPKYYSGVPCLSAFRFPAPQNGADIAPFSLIVLHCFAKRCFNPLRRILVGSVFQFIS